MKKILYKLSSLLLISILILNNQIIFGKEEIKTFGPYDFVNHIQYSPDGKSFVYMAERDGKSFVVKNGIEGNGYFQVSTDFASPIVPISGYGLINGGNDFLGAFTPDSKSFFYVAGTEDGKFFVVKDGVEGAKYDRITGTSISFSPNSNSFTYEAKKVGKNLIIKDGKELGEGMQAVYSPDGKSFAYVKLSEGSLGNSWAPISEQELSYKKSIIIKDGKELGEGMQAIYSSDGKSFAYLAKKDGKVFVVKDGKELGEGMQAIYSSDGKSFAYVTRKDGKHLIIKNGKELGELKDYSGSDYNYSGSQYFDLRYSSNLESFAYLIKKDGKIFVVKDGVEGTKYDEISDIIYSPDGKSFAYVAKKDGKRFMVKDGVEGTKYDDIICIIFPKNGKSFSYEAKKDGKRFIIKDGKELGEGADGVYSSDGKSFAYVTIKNGNGFIIKDGKELGKGSRPVYSPDGRSFAYRTVKDGKYFVIQITNDQNVLSNNEINSNTTSSNNPNNSNPTNQFKVITDSQKEFVNKKIANYNESRINTVLSKIDILLGKNLSEKNKNLLNDLKIILEERLNSLK